MAAMILYTNIWNKNTLLTGCWGGFGLAFPKHDRLSFTKMNPRCRKCSHTISKAHPTWKLKRVEVQEMSLKFMKLRNLPGIFDVAILLLT